MSENEEQNTEQCCSFCGTKADLKNKLIKGIRDSYICSRCAHDVQELFDEFEEAINKRETVKSSSKEKLEKFTPSKIREFLDQYVLGQEKAKKVLSVAVYNHYKKIEYAENPKAKVEMDKSNVLLIGNTGVGKTELIRTISRMLKVPLVIQDSTKITESGYVGEDPEIVLRKLIQKADGDIKLAEKGIIYLDEFDKIARKGGENVSITRDVSGEGVQQAILKIIEGDIVEVPVNGTRKHPNGEMYKIDSSKILFICGGSFEGIEKIIARRTKESVNTIGFGSKVKAKEELNYDDIINEVTNDDLLKYGIIQEVLGRLPVKCTLNKLTKEHLINILTEPKNAIIKQYQELFAMDNISLMFEQEALEAIADKANELGTGARALRTVLEEVMLPHMYSIPDDPAITEVIITKECIEDNKSPILKKKEAV